MANTLTSLTPDIFEALDVVSRELIGFIPATLRSSSADRVALGASLRSPVTPVTSNSDVAPSMTIPAAAYQAITNKAFVISKTRFNSFSWSGEDLMSVNGGGPGADNIIANQFAQSMRSLVNEMENDIASAARLGATRATGTAGTTPFATTVGGTAQARKILDDNGAPANDRHLVIDTTAGAALRTLYQLTRANEAGDTSMLRQGTLLNLHNFDVKESAKIQPTTAGTGASYTTSTAGFAVGATTLNVITGTGTILAGDVITINGDTNQYVVATGFAGDGTGSITIAAPGLLKAVPTSAKAITIVASFTPNCAFSRNAILFGTRLCALPPQGDLAIDRMVATDDRSGISFEVALYPGYRMVTYQVSAAWGVAVEKPEHLALLLG